MEHDEMVEAYSLNDSTKAAMIKQFLEAEGIYCYVAGENAADLGLSAFGIKIMVRGPVAKRARKIIEKLEIHKNDARNH